MRRTLRVLAGAVVLLTTAHPVFADPTALVIIPIPEVQETGTYGVGLTLQGKQMIALDDSTVVIDTEFGPLERVEAGVDFQVAGRKKAVLLNWKYRFLVGRTHLAVGTYNTGLNVSPANYLISGTEFSENHLYLGVQYFDDRFQMLAGAKRDIGRLRLVGDYTLGEHNLASAGFEYDFSENWQLLWGAIFDSTSEGGTSYFMELTYSNRLFKPPRPRNHDTNSL